MEEEQHFTKTDRQILTEVKVKLDRAIDDIAKLSSNFVFKVEFNDLKKQVDSLADNNKWLVRVVIGIVIVAILSLVIIKK